MAVIFRVLDGSVLSPEPRTGHCATMLSENVMLIYGGYCPGHVSSDETETETGCPLRDSWIFDLALEQWSEVVFSGNPPQGGLGSSADAMGKRVYFFGGFDGTNYTNDVSTCLYFYL